MNLFFRRYGVWLLNFLAVSLFSQTDSVFKLTTLTVPLTTHSVAPGIVLNHCWKYQKGDDIKWADTSYNDKDWKYSSTELIFKESSKGYFENCGWFRLRIHVDSQLLNKPIAFMIDHLGASEIYLDGKLITSFGKIDATDIIKDEMYYPSYEPRAFIFKGGCEHLLAVRYHNTNAIQDSESKLVPAAGFEIKLGDLNESISYLRNDSFFYKGIMVFYFAFFLALGILHLLIFIFYPENKSNLYYTIFAFAFGLVFMVQAFSQITHNPGLIRSIISFSPIVPLFYSFGILAMLYTIFYSKILKILWVWVGLMIAYIISLKLKMPIPFISNLLTLFVIIEPIRVIIVSIYKKKEGAWILGSGVITTIVFFTTAILLIAGGHSEFLFNNGGWKGAIVGIVVLISTLSIPLSMSAYLARQFSKTNKDLQKKLIEVEELSAKSIEQEKEKQKILESQNENLEKQVKERTTEVVHQKRMIEEKQKEMIDSIKYAKRIQRSL